MATLILRHAEAVDEGRGLPDEHRYLTAAGRAAARAVADELAARGLRPERVVASPLVRAQQTAEVVWHRLGLDCVIETSGWLAPDGSVRRAADVIAEGGGVLTLAVGHEPSISALAGLLAGDPGFPSMRKAQACLVDQDALLAWFGSDRRGS